MAIALKFILAYLGTLLVMLAIDLAWLGVIAKDLYRGHIGHLLAPTPNWQAALLFYFIYVAGVSFFAIYPSYASGAYLTAALIGALFGFFAYATYDLTNLATLRDWSTTLTVIDILWGSFLTSVVSVIGVYIMRLIHG